MLFNNKAIQTVLLPYIHALVYSYIQAGLSLDPQSYIFFQKSEMKIFAFNGLCCQGGFEPTTTT